MIRQKLLTSRVSYKERVEPAALTNVPISLFHLQQMSTNSEGSHFEGGYDYQFMETPSDDLICKICQYPSRNPYLSVCCGHVFCKSCLDACSTTSFNVVCPMCRSLQFQGFVNKQIDRKVRSLHVFCVNKEKGCRWKGEINNISNHLDEKCQFQDIRCPYLCETIMQRQQLPYHMKHECVRRIVKCKYCHLFRGEFQCFRQHLMECPSFLWCAICFKIMHWQW